MVIFPVTESKRLRLEQRFRELGCSEHDLEETFVRSGGKGGQHLNKTSTCVILRHIPTGLEVRCQDDRSQSLNRYRARVLLLDKLEAMIKGRLAEQQQKIAKIRRQKRKRSKRAELKRLADKAHESEKKSLRAKPDVNEI